MEGAIQDYKNQLEAFVALHSNMANLTAEINRLSDARKRIIVDFGLLEDAFLSPDSIEEGVYLVGDHAVIVEGGDGHSMKAKTIQVREVKRV